MDTAPNRTVLAMALNSVPPDSQVNVLALDCDLIW